MTEQEVDLVDADRGRALTRRHLLVAGTGLGAAGVAAALGARPAMAAGTPVVPEAAPITGAGPFGTAAPGDPALTASVGLPPNAPDPVPGATMRTITANTFIPAGPDGSTLGGVLGPPVGAFNTTGSALFAPLDLPTGATLRQVDCYAQNTAAATPFPWALLTIDNAGNSTSTDPNDGAGAMASRISFLDLHVVVGPHDQVVMDITATSATHYAVAVTYQYVPATPGFHPIAPARVYDSRYNTPGGIVPAGASRLISVADAYAQGSNTLIASDIVPAGAVAIAYNLTVTGTAAAGYLQLNPGSATAVTGSSINWAAGQTIANAGVVTLDATRHVKAFPIGGSTHVIVDVQGYYL